MNLRLILVLAVLKQSLGCDFDRLQELANKHTSVRQMMGHCDAVFDSTRSQAPAVIGFHKFLERYNLLFQKTIGKALEEV